MSCGTLARRARGVVVYAVWVVFLPVDLLLYALRSDWIETLNQWVHDPLRRWWRGGWMRDGAGRWYNMKRWQHRGVRFERRERPLRRLWQTWVRRLPDPAYELRLPFRIETVQYEDDGSFESRWRYTNIAIGGDSRRDAEKALMAEILDTYDTLVSERRLGVDAENQLDDMHRFIGRSGGK